VTLERSRPGVALHIALVLGTKDAPQTARTWGFDEHFGCFSPRPDVKDAVDTTASKTYRPSAEGVRSFFGNQMER
jgi:hypothetical protein